MDLDASIYNGNFDLNQRDSGAILVGAGYSSSRNPHCWTNYGNRVDAQGWGDSVVTTGYGYLFNGTQDGGVNDSNRYYTSSFSGTSSASPIVTGSAATIQGRYKYIAEGAVPSPFEMRMLISNTGTTQGTGGSWGYKPIGPLPNIEDALSALSESDDDGYRQCFPWEDPIIDNCDCNDNEYTVNPGMSEGPVGDSTCSDLKDNDCDGLIDMYDSNCVGAIDICGAVSGTAIAGNTYNITCDIIVNSGESLTIESGAIITNLENYSLTVNGVLTWNP